MPRTTFSAAAAEVARRDSVMARLMKRLGLFRLPRPATDPFASLARSILYNKVASIRALAANVADGTVSLDRLSGLNVWPLEDYGIRKGYALAYGLRNIPTSKRLQAEGDRFRPYWTVAAWYCWRAVHEPEKAHP